MIVPGQLATLRELWRLLDPRRRRQFALLLVLMVLAAFAEVVSIAAVLPFLSVMLAPERVFNHEAARPLIEALGITQPSELLLPITVAFCMAALLAGAIRLLLLWASTRLSFAAGADISLDIYRRTLYQPYSVHAGRNSSEVITGISTKSNTVIFNIINPALNFISASLILVAILLLLLSIHTVVALAALGGFGLIYLFVVKFTHRPLQRNSQIIAHESNQLIKSLQEGLGGIRDVLLDGTQPAYCAIYRRADLALRHAQGTNQFYGMFPRFVVETLGILLIAALAFALTQQEQGIAAALPVLGALALGAQRMLPLLQQAYGSWALIRGSQGSLIDVITLLKQPLPAHASSKGVQPLPFKEQIEFKGLSFRYGPSLPWVLNEVNLVIPKGGRVGFVGSTGSGKSTLLDVLMALLHPSSGALLVDGVPITPANSLQWQAHIAHVPQAIFLADASIAENIAFGIPPGEVDHALVREAAQRAQLAATIESWPEQYQTHVGERGVRLSGGQRQRIGIARALYKQADVIVFDEATSALDTETEQAVMEAIDALDKELTVLIIAHRLSTLSNCDRIVELSDGGLRLA